MAETTNKKEISDKYFAAVQKRIQTAQSSGDVDNSFAYSFNGKTWVMTLPPSVMTQKRLLHLRDFMLKNPDDADADETFIRTIAKYVQANGSVVNVDVLEYGELEVMKLAYLDALLLPLSLGGGMAVEKYMETAIANLK